MKCSNCGAEIENGAQFCRNCGAPAYGPGDNICPTCGVNNPPGETYCQSCGWPLNQAADMPPNPDYQDPYGYPEQVQKSSMSTPLIVLIVLLIFAIVGGAIFLGYHMFSSNKSTPTRVQTQNTASRNRSSNTQSDNSGSNDDSYYNSGNSNSSNNSNSNSNNYSNSNSNSNSSSNSGNTNNSGNTKSSTPTYEYVVANVTFSEAVEGAKSRGGRLATPKTQAEFNQMVAGLTNLRNNGSDGRNFFIGAARSGDTYYWVDRNGNITNEAVNLGSWFWLPGEPTFYDESTGANEDVLEVLFVKADNRWYGNDTVRDPVSVFPELSGQVGYVVQYD